MADEALNKFGEFLVKNLRNSGIGFAEGLLKNHRKAPKFLALQDDAKRRHRRIL
jgi:hypothetical protein